MSTVLYCSHVVYLYSTVLDACSAYYLLMLGASLLAQSQVTSTVLLLLPPPGMLTASFMKERLCSTVRLDLCPRSSYTTLS